MSKLYNLKWLGDDVLKVAEKQLCEILTEFAQIAEAEAKKELKKTGGTPRRDRRKGKKGKIIDPHGVVTGTLRRSVHVASPDYNFSSDDVEPSNGTVERGGKKITPKKIGNRFTLSLGSGMSYAMLIHQGWGSFKGYHYLTNGVEKAKAKMNQIIARHQVKA
jgi:hypothetical protein